MLYHYNCERCNYRLSEQFQFLSMLVLKLEKGNRKKETVTVAITRNLLISKIQFFFLHAQIRQSYLKWIDVSVLKNNQFSCTTTKTTYCSLLLHVWPDRLVASQLLHVKALIWEEVILFVVSLETARQYLFTSDAHPSCSCRDLWHCKERKMQMTTAVACMAVVKAFVQQGSLELHQSSLSVDCFWRGCSWNVMSKL